MPLGTRADVAPAALAWFDGHVLDAAGSPADLYAIIETAETGARFIRSRMIPGGPRPLDCDALDHVQPIGVETQCLDIDRLRRAASNS